MAKVEFTHPVACAQPASLPERAVAPLVSVVIPAYCCCATIVQALESVFAQSFTDYEVLVVNDGSPDTDELEQVLSPYLKRIRYIRQGNGGPSAARNTGIENARGEYVALLDSDDFWLPQHLENQIYLLQFDPGLGLVYANGVILEHEQPVGRAFDFEPQRGPVTFDAILEESCTVSTSSVVARRQEMLDAGLFDESFRRCEDFDLWLRMRHQGTRMDFSSELQFCHRRGNGLASDRRLMREGRKKVYQKTASLHGLPEAQRQTIARMTAAIDAECQVDAVKQSLVARHYSDALDAARTASTALRGWKLRCAVTGLRAAPGVLRQSYLAYLRVLAVRQRTRTARRMRNIELPPVATYWSSSRA